ncbi:alcohol dehydrogenase [Burkholderia aenigmatica]|uniref:Alcohol dehydrogenase n=1 Tax=Burkholderia aenigmatica TaxID=2015348 RepID=A0ABY6XVI4_9BURK|nr:MULTISPECIES: zinc-binding dehydrogenase [Burkholderia]AYQ37959.1 alcohol dehydrogenase [Burkholderia lata]UKD12729.1 zinc-binding dehydrogenase [Burkholderia aenigmatica]VWC58515.1 alcohol dehydrogenase [Burkholderia aenigmatica]VWC64523.1 alcohol dehydrogenase [Burkholderia aenigmatica]VWD02475.1 alcohol dehydrogenase [Burkholderia aenigmatica]
MNTMQAIQIERTGDTSVLRTVTMDRPTPADDEVLVRVSRVGLNFAETLQRAGTYPGPALALPAVLGSEAVGTVAAVGANVRDIQVGERVAAPLFGAWRSTGGYAEYVTLHAALIVAIPDALSDDDAVAVMLQGLVARLLLRETPVAERTVAITAAAGGVGSMLIQLARLDGARSITGVTSSPAKLHTAKTLGADHVVNYRDEDWRNRLSAATGGAGFDVVFDSIGGTVAHALVSSLATHGHFVSYGAASGRLLTIDENLMNALIFGSRSVSGFALYAFLADDVVRRTIAELFELLAAGALKPLIGGSFAFDAVADAHRALESGQASGKLILRVQ